MISSSRSISRDSLRNTIQNPSINEEKSLGSVEFPSIVEAYGANGERRENPKIGNSSQPGGEGVSTGIKQTELVLSVNTQMSMDVGKNSSSSLIENKSTPKNWREILPTPRPVVPQPKMEFTPPTEINGKRTVASMSENFTEGIRNCENLVVGFFVGKRGSFAAVQNAVSKLWKLKNEVSIKLHGNCAFIFEFKDEEDRKNALETGSFYIGIQLFTLRPWSQLLEKTISEIKTVPIWVMIYGVPLHMWNNKGLSLIASYIGIPLFVDECTLNKDRLAFARICVEIDVDFDYPKSIPLLIDGKISMELPVEYQWKPSKCELCKVFGHSDNYCTVKRKTRWTPRKDKVMTMQPTTEAKNVTDDNGAIRENDLAAHISLEGPRGEAGGKSLDDAGTPDTSTTSASISVSKGESDGLVSKNQTTSKISSLAKTTDKSGASVLNSSVRVLALSGEANTEVAETEKGEDNDQGDWIIAGKKNKKGNKSGGLNSQAINKTSSPAKTGTKCDSKGSGVGVGTTDAASLRAQKLISHNPFMVYSDFQEGSRFPINKTKEMEARNVSSTSKVIVDRVQNEEEVLTGEEEEDSDDMNDYEIEDNRQYMSLEDKYSKRKEREMHRLKWNANEGSSSNGNQVALGRGQRTQNKIHSSSLLERK